MITTLTLNPALDITLEVNGLHVEDVNRVCQFHEEPGGKGINVSRVLIELGERRINTLAVLGGEHGKRFKVLACQKGFRCKHVMVSDETRMNIAIFNHETRKTTKLNQAGPRVTRSEAVKIWRMSVEVARKSRFFIMAGSLLPDIPTGWYGKLIRSVRRERPLFVVDTDGEALKAALPGRPFLIKPNRFEAERALGRKLTHESSLWWAARRLRSLGAENVIISLGREGALFCGLRERWRAYSVPVKINSTVGAGDSFLAGFVSQIAKAKRVEEALRYAVACGTHAAMTGATDLCRKSQVMKLLPHIKIQKR